MANKNVPPPAAAAAAVAVVIVPLPAQGHLNQLLQLSLLLSSTYGVAVHYAAAAPYNRQVRLRIPSVPTPLLYFHDLEVPPFPSPPPDPSTFFPTHLLPVLTTASSTLRLPIAHLLRSLAAANGRLAIIHDSLMAGAVQDAIDIPNTDLYAFHSTSAFNNIAFRWQVSGHPSSLTADLLRRPLHLAAGESHLTEEDLETIPTLAEFWPEEMTELVVSQHKILAKAKGRILNSCRDLEGEFLDMLSRNDRNGTKYFAIGPFMSTTTTSSRPSGGHECMEWLQKQPEKSVLYVSFGTTITMSVDQIKELALGLENSGHRFLWVLRDADTVDIFSGEEKGGRRRPWELLPEGYEGRVRGLVVKEWVPQTAILGHPSTGGFMSHCGWNSCQEALCMGVPLAAWPMHSDQTNNAILMTKLLRVGVPVEGRAERRLVAAAAVEKTVRRLMETAEGDEVRRRAGEVKGVIMESVREGGVARREMDSFFDYLSR